MFKLLKESMICEDIGAEKTAILKRLQYVMKKDMGINASVESLRNLFAGKRLHEDQEMINGMKEEGFKVGGGWETNKDFWKGLLTEKEYKLLTTIAETFFTESYNTMVSDAVLAKLAKKVRLMMRNSDKTRDAAITAVTSDFLQQNPELAHGKDHWIDLWDKVSHLLDNEAFEDEAFSKKGEVTPKDYATWKRVLKGEAKDRGVNLNNKRSFMDLAMEMLDNDPMMDFHGFGEKTKEHIASILWQQFGIDEAKRKAKAAQKMLPKKVAEDEEEEKFRDEVARGVTDLG